MPPYAVRKYCISATSLQIVQQKHMSRSSSTIREPFARSRVTNGNAVLPNVDGRSIWVRRLYDVIAQHTSDLGGEDALSEAQKSIIRRIGT